MSLSMQPNPAKNTQQSKSQQQSEQAVVIPPPCPKCHKGVLAESIIGFNSIKHECRLSCGYLMIWSPRRSPSTIGPAFPLSQAEARWLGVEHDPRYVVIGNKYDKEPGPEPELKTSPEEDWENV